MTVYKDKMNTIEFKVENYTFESFTSSLLSQDDHQPKNFEFVDIKSLKSDHIKHEKIIKNERAAAQKNNFQISPVVLEHRGLLNQENQEREQKIQDEVERRLVALQEKAFEQGFEKGMEQGLEQVFNQTRQETEERLEAVSEMISNVLTTEKSLIEDYKTEIYNTVKSLTKWMILRELKDDGEYLSRLLEKLILEINSRSNLLIKVSEQSFSAMPEVLEIVQSKLGKFKNLRVEVDQDLCQYGICVESDNGIVNASLEQQLQAIDKLFETLGVKTPESEE